MFQLQLHQRLKNGHRRIWCALLLCTLSNAAIGADLFDTDGDSFVDALDNCVFVGNEDQRDTDGDGIGNACDPDLNQDCIVNFLDIAAVSQLFLSADENADLTGDGLVNFEDYAVYAQSFGQPPGPSGPPNLCLPTFTLTLQGSTGPVPFGGGAITAIVDQTTVGGGIEVLNTIANPDGTFEFLLEGVNGTDFVTLAAVGLGAQAGASLTSVAGSVTRLFSQGGGDGTVDFSQATALALSPVTTAFSVLASEANQGDLNSTTELLLSEVGVDASELLELAALIDAIIVDPEVTLPAGATDTVTLASNPADRQDFRVRVYSELAANLEAAAVRVADYDDNGFAEEDVTGTQRINYLNNLITTSAAELQFGVGNAVTYQSEISGAGTWSLEADGSLQVTLTPALLTSSFIVSIEDPTNPGVFVQAEQNFFLGGVKVHRVRAGRGADTVIFTRQTFTNFTDFPQLGDTPTTDTDNIATARLLVGENVIVPFSMLELTDSGLAVNYAHQLNAAQGIGGDVFLGFDTLDFNVDGTGQSRRRGFEFAWNVLADGELSVVFSNGDSNRFRRLFVSEDGTWIGQVTYQIAGQGEVLKRSFFVPHDESVGFSEATVENATYRSMAASASTFALPDVSVFDFVFSPGGQACRNPDSASSSWAWTLQDGRIELLRDFGQSVDLFFFRTWQPLRVVDDNYWLIETFQIDSTDVPLIDAAVTPGRLNLYRFTHDSAGNSRPALNADTYTTSIDTPLTIYLSDLLSNDVDPEGDQIIYRSLLPTAASGSLVPVGETIVYPYAFTYQPPAGFTGVETFELTASDIACRGDDPPPTSTLTITVN